MGGIVNGPGSGISATPNRTNSSPNAKTSTCSSCAPPGLRRRLARQPEVLRSAAGSKGGRCSWPGLVSVTTPSWPTAVSDVAGGQYRQRRDQRGPFALLAGHLGPGDVSDSGLDRHVLLGVEPLASDVEDTDRRRPSGVEVSPALSRYV